jgi:hypothetical protein
MRDVTDEEGDAAMADYRYKLRRGEKVIATGHLRPNSPWGAQTRPGDKVIVA